MKKLIKFQPSAKTFFDIAEDKYDEGDYPAAVHYFFQSYLRHNDTGSLIALGETYADMGEPERGLKYLFMALSRDYENPDIRESIAECFFDMDDEETAFFYYRRSMSVKHFHRLMDDCDHDNDSLVHPPIRVLEKDDDMALQIALKLLQSGDNVYAKEILLTIKPESQHFCTACNLLSLTALDDGEPQKALDFALKSLEKTDGIDCRCDMMMAYHAMGEYENAQKQADYIEKFKPKTEQHKAIAFAFIKMGDAKRAAKHLKALYDANLANRDSLVSYALSLYDVGQKEQARLLMIKAVRMYPEDVTVKALAAAMRQGRRLGLYPLLPDDIAKEYSEQIENKLALIIELSNGELSNGEKSGALQKNKCGEESGALRKNECGEESGVLRKNECGEESGTLQKNECGEESGTLQKNECGEESGTLQKNECGEESGALRKNECGEESGVLRKNKCGEESGVLQKNAHTLADGKKDFFDDEEFKEKITWLFQTRLSVSQGRAALILGRYKRWHPFLREQLLDNYLDLPVKKSCLFSLLLFGGREKTGIVLGGFYTRLNPRYPEGMDGRFRAAYCLAFASYAFSDTGFEGRLFAAAGKLLNRYQKYAERLTSEDALAAVIFFAAGHKKITDPVNCAHLFGCEVDKMKEYMDCLGVRKIERNA